MTRVFYKSLERVLTFVAVVFSLNFAVAEDNTTSIVPDNDHSFLDSTKVDPNVLDGVFVVCYRDQDGDGYGNPFLTLNQATCGGGWVSNNQDCNDNNASINPGVAEVCNFTDDDCDLAIDEDFAPVTIYGDFDGDGYGTPFIDGSSRQTCPLPTGYVYDNTDCEDNDAAINPGQSEICNGINDDCAGGIDDGFVLTTFYYDLDADGFGDNANPVDACVAGPSMVSDNTDCEDGDPFQFPGNAEICNGLDENCNGLIDEDFDLDGDGWATCEGDCDDSDPNVNPGMMEGPFQAGSCDFIDNNCDGVIDEFWDQDLDGFTVCELDCNDLDDQIFPGQTEICDNIDSNCDGILDQDLYITSFLDADSDGFGFGAVDTAACDIPVGYVDNADDCDDTNNAINPVALEICDEVDNNCNGEIDEGVTIIYFEDVDGDTFGGANSIEACVAPVGFVETSDDCDDANANVYPDAAELCNFIDDNCDGVIDEGFDVDADGFFVCQGDCNDNDATIFPGAIEVCDGIDQDCDGVADNGLATQTYFADADGDGFGDAAMDSVNCIVPVGYVLDNTDCNDADDTVYPGAAELCDGIDQDCDGVIDNGLATQTYYADVDGDGFGDPLVDSVSCDIVVGYVTDNTDCNDADNTIFPGAPELCDGIDQNCDGNADNGATELLTYYADVDGDLFGDPAVDSIACGQPIGYVLDNTDCDDNDNTINPGAAEICDAIDQNCNGLINDGLPILTYYPDNDLDGFGLNGSSIDSCAAPAGYVLDNTDCDDADALVNPGVVEACNGIDDNCDGNIDEGFDVDGDGFTVCQDDCNDNDPNINPGVIEGLDPIFCDGIDNNCDGNIDELYDQDGDGFTFCGGDCDDTNDQIFPGAVEVCDGLDQDCDGVSDNGLTQTYYADADGDGFGDAAMDSVNCIVPVGYVLDNTDCNDADDTVYPGAAELCDGIDQDCDGVIDNGLATQTYYADVDGDGFGDPLADSVSCDIVVGYVVDNTDCNDADNTIFPGAVEVCDGVDQDCDGVADNGLTQTYYADADGDGFGDPAMDSVNCIVPVGYVLDNTDCNDADDTVYPGAAELCDGIDQDCDGVIDNGLATQTYYADVDGDGFGDPLVDSVSCDIVVGYVTDNTDCNDADNTIFPGAPELCDGIDQNCDGNADNGATELLTYYADADGDLFGDPAVDSIACGQPIGYVLDNTDCDDNDNTINPGAAEICDAIDQNCNGLINDGLPILTYYPDNDLDGFGLNGSSIDSCAAPAGYVLDNTDCDDADALVNPGVVEACNGIDDNCDGSTDEGFDVDGDGFTVCQDDCDDNNANINPGIAEGIDPAFCDGIDNNCDGNIDELYDQDGDGFTFCGGDCDDTNDQIFPGAVEVCDGLDQDCDGVSDNGLTQTYYADADGDGFGDAAMDSVNCIVPVGYVLDNTDCNDADDTVYPGAAELCDGIDQDCDGVIDNGLATQTYYADVDGDGFGDPLADSVSCDIVVGYVTDNTDCNDADNTIFPGAPELCDGIDQNCDGNADNGATGLLTYYADADGDLFGDPAVDSIACGQPIGYVLDNTDCDDNDNTINPGAAEICDAIDQNCNGLINDGLPILTYYPDNDLDGFGLNGSSIDSCAAPAGYVLDNTDCDDADALVNPGAVEACNGIDDNCDGSTDEGFDVDGDGFTVCQDDCDDNNANINPGIAEGIDPAFCDGIDNNCDGNIDELYDQDGDGFTFCGGDCDDTNDQIFPGAVEVCDGLDQDCDGVADSGLTQTYYADADGDGFGDAAMDSVNCIVPVGYVLDNTDCNDADDTVYPGAAELCDGIDQDCDGVIDNGLATQTYYADVDGDGFGDPLADSVSCDIVVGYVTDNTDCNDADNTIFPGAPELCDGIDQNCDGNADNGGTELLTYYADVDGDLFGDPAVDSIACGQPIGYVVDNTDCNDANNTVFPGAPELCDGLDNNCDGLIDEGLLVDYYPDLDNDGYGDINGLLQSCVAIPDYVTDFTDCNDADASINVAAPEICNNIDDNCNGAIDDGINVTYYLDADLDGFGDFNSPFDTCAAPTGYVLDNTDCNDADNTINPGAIEICDGLDQNCNGISDDGISNTYYADVDGDTYGDLTATKDSCDVPVGYVINSLDCDDNNAAINPLATEVCDGVDNNCDGAIDEGFPTTTYYADLDLDGFGDVLNDSVSCSVVPGYILDNTDCNDLDNTIYPGAPEICDGIDQNCDGDADGGFTSLALYYLDNDLDGYGVSDPTTDTLSCGPPAGYTSQLLDCDDLDALVNPLAVEICNGIDDNCDLNIDEGFDVDGDGYTSCQDDCDDNNPIINPGIAEGVDPAYCDGIDNNCDGNIDELYDQDGDGFTFCGGDCNDFDANININAVEICNGVDDNCDGQTDEGLTTTYYADADGDGFGDLNNPKDSCDVPVGYVLDNSDCLDSDANVNPNAIEVCNGIDDDCNGLVDDGSLPLTLYYIDGDLDGYGVADPLTDSLSCSVPAGYSAQNGDCDDLDAAINPGATEICNALDDNCDGTIDEGFDQDGDGYSTCQDDCDDNNASINPGILEGVDPIYCDNIDNNCDGNVDELYDQDGDGFTICQNDCDDLNDQINPNGVEVCNDLDDNCDGNIDEGLGNTYYADADGDGFGDPLVDSLSCDVPVGFVLDNTDCDDSNNLIFPGAVEICNFLDDDCDGQVDEGALVGTIVPSVAITASQLNICTGASVTFTATPTDGGTLPIYEWQINGVTVNTNVDNYTTSNLFDGDTIRVIMTSNSLCLAVDTAVSNELVMVVGSNDPIVDIIDNVASDTICAGSIVTFIANITNGGTAPVVNWTVNGVSAVLNNTTYITDSLSNGDIVKATLISNATCLSSTEGADSITVIVSPLLSPSVDLTVSDSTICEGDQVIFTLVPNDGGSSPVYSWYLNGTLIPSETNNTFTTTELINGDEIFGRVVSNNLCQAYSTSQSLTISMDVLGVQDPTVVIAASDTDICFGDQVDFTATPTNGGVAPTYEWTVNGIVVGNNLPTYSSSSLQNGDVINVTMTADNACTLNNVVAALAPVTMNVTDNTPTVVLTSDDADNSICAGSQVDFTATPTNGGIAPVYTWTINGNVVTGQTTSSFITTTLVDGDIVQVTLVSNATCLSNNNVLSNSIQMDVLPLLDPQVSVNASQTSICANDEVTFTAVPVDGGLNPTYSWEVNGVATGVTTATFVTSTLLGGDQVSVVMGTTNVCQTNASVESAPIVMTVGGNAPDVSISNNAVNNTICDGSAILFTATPTNPGNSPQYVWKVNEIVQSGVNSSTFTYLTPVNGDVVEVILLSNATCLTNPSDSASNLPLIVEPLVTPSVTIAQSATSICAGVNVDFTSTVTNGGTAPLYQWQVNGINVPGATLVTFSTSTLADNDVITLQITSNAACLNTAVANSNALNIDVEPIVTPSVSIAANPGNTICLGDAVTFTANAVDAGTTPLYQWTVNGANVGPNGVSNTYTPVAVANGDVINVIVTANNTCQTSSTATAIAGISMVVNSVTPTVAIASDAINDLVCSGVPVVYTATVTNEGTSPVYTWAVNGIVDPTATGAVFNQVNPIDGQTVVVTLTSDAACATVASVSATSNVLTVEPFANPSALVSIVANDLCAGEDAVFNVVATDAGINPTYDWLVNGISQGIASSTTATFAGLIDGDQVSVSLTADVNCSATPVVVSNAIDVNILPSIDPILTLTPSATDICQGAQVDFTTSITPGMTNVNYVWDINGTVAGAGSTFSSTTLQDGQIVTVTATILDDLCLVNDILTASQTINVTLPLIPVVTVNSDAPGNAVCAGDDVVLTATAIDAGANPNFDWVDVTTGATVATGTDTYTIVNPTVDMTIQVTVTSDDLCSVGSTDTDDIVITVTPATPPSVTLVSDAPGDVACEGTDVLLTATILDAGLNPTYEWIDLNSGSVISIAGPTLNILGLSSDMSIELNVTSSDACTLGDVVTAVLDVTMLPTAVPSAEFDVDLTEVCAGDIVTYSVQNELNTGANPTWEWSVNGTVVSAGIGAAFDSYSYAPAAGDVVSLTVLSNEVCASTLPEDALALSNVTVNPLVTTGVTVTSDDIDNSICEGTPVTFTAVASNVLGAETYQWFVNGALQIGETNSVFTTSALSNGDDVTVEMNGDNICEVSDIVTDGVIDFIVLPVNTVSVTLSSDAVGNAACEGSDVIITASSVDVTTIAAYEWVDLNTGTIVSTTGPTYTITGLAADMSIGLVITSGDVCSNGVTSGQEIIDITMLPLVTPSVELQSDGNNVCAGTPVTFTAFNALNQGLNPQFNWLVNGISQQNGPLDVFTYTPVNGDQVTLLMTSDELCVTLSEVASVPAQIDMIIIDIVDPTISITADQPNTICFDTPVSFTADTLNAGIGAVIEWYAGPVGAEVLVGTGDVFGPTVLNDQDNVFAVLFPTNTCQTFAQITSNVELFTVITNTPTVALTNDLGSNTICAGTHPLFTANATLGGVDPIFVWTYNGVEIQNGLNNTLNTDALTFVTGDVIEVTMTSNETCLTTNDVLDNATLDVLSNVVPVLSITVPASICENANLDVQVDIANSANLGANPIYDWFVLDNAGIQVQNIANGGPAVSITGVLDGYQVYANVTSDALCADPTTVSSPVSSVIVIPNENPSVTLSSLEDPAVLICSLTGQTITANATVVEGGAYTLDWSVNGTTITTGDVTGTFVYPVTADGPINIAVLLNPVNTCQIIDPLLVNATLNTFTAFSNTPEVSVTTPNASVCANSDVTFTAAPVSTEDVAPTYEWFVNTILVQSGPSATYTATGVTADLNVQVVMSSGETCLTQPSDDATVTVTVTPLTTPTVSIALTSTTACPSDAISYTATESPLSGGTSTFDWYVNGVMVQSSASNLYTSSSFVDNDSIYVVLNSGAACIVPGAVNSDTLEIFVDELYTPVLTGIVASQDSVCGSADPIDFSANGTDFGPSPTYAWVYTDINGVQTNFNTPTVSISNVAAGETVSLTIVPNNACQTVTNLGPVTWTGIDGTVTPSVAITLSADTFCVGTTEDFVVSAQNQGSTPVYNWYVNDVLVAANTALFNTTSLNNADTVYVELLSNASCLSVAGPVLSNEIVVTIEQPLSPIIDILVNGTTADSICDFTSATISADVINPGSSVTYEWSLNGVIISDSIAFDSDTLETNDVIQLVVTNVNSCTTVSDTVSLNITVLPIPNISAALFTSPSGVTQICEDDISTLFQFFSVDGATNYSATWALDSVSTGIPAILGQSISLTDLPGALGYLQIEIVPLDLCASGTVYSNGVTIAPNLNYYADADGDGYGDINGTPIFTCNPGPGYVTDATDCDDTNAAINPGAAEICGDNLDNDCNGVIDDGPCPGVDADGDGYPYPDDCNDNDPSINPGATEICGNAIDENCDGWDASVWYIDADGDGFGDTTDIYLSYDCAVTEVIGYVSSANPLDCNDDEPTVYPGAPEICDSLDNDCNGFIDDGAGVVWFYDGDLDGFGAADSIYPGLLCYEPGPEWSQVPGDCDNENGLVFPFSDSDNDDALGCIDDCDDTNPNISPNIAEVCDSIDNDCDLLVDEGVQFYYYPDADNDEFGVATDSIGSCSFVPPAFYAANTTDCNDADYNINPGATELCGNDVDENCDSELLGECYPDAFSPNGDGVGDVYVYRSPYRDASITMEVYNRWGAKIYYTESAVSDAQVRWNGIPNFGPDQSDVVPAGTYFAIFTEDGVQRVQTITIWK